MVRLFAVVLLVGLITLGIFLMLGGDADVDFDPGHLDVDFDAPKVDADAPSVDVDPGRLDIDPADPDEDRDG
jgi:hypothetical protein